MSNLFVITAVTLIAAQPREHVVLARLLDDQKTALLVLQDHSKAADLDKQLRQTAHVTSVDIVTLPTKSATLAIVRTDRAMASFDARMMKTGLTARFQEVRTASAFEKHIGIPIAVELPPVAGTEAFRTAEKILQHHFYDHARHQFDALVTGNALNHWALLRLADIAAATQGKAAGCVGYRHVIDAAPLHLAAKVATLRSLYLQCDGTSYPDWLVWLQPVHRDDTSGGYLRAESQWAFWEVITPEIAADVFNAGTSIATPAQRQRLLAIACLGLHKDALGLFVRQNIKDILDHPQEKALRLVMSHTLCGERESAQFLLKDGHWTPPVPLQGWTSSWRKALSQCHASPAATTLGSTQSSPSDVVELERLLQGAASRITALNIAVRSGHNQQAERK